MAVGAEEAKKQTSRVGELLKRNGYEIDESASWMWVTVELFSYLVTSGENDPDFYRLTFPIGLVDKDKRREEYLNAINTANAGSKLAKAFLDKSDDLNIVVDVVASGPEEFVANFARYVSAIQTSHKLFDDESGG